MIKVLIKTFESLTLESSIHESGSAETPLPPPKKKNSVIKTNKTDEC